MLFCALYLWHILDAEYNSKSLLILTHSINPTPNPSVGYYGSGTDAVNHRTILHRLPTELQYAILRLGYNATAALPALPIPLSTAAYFRNVTYAGGRITSQCRIADITGGFSLDIDLSTLR